MRVLMPNEKELRRQRKKNDRKYIALLEQIVELAWKKQELEKKVNKYEFLDKADLLSSKELGKYALRVEGYNRVSMLLQSSLAKWKEAKDQPLA